MARSVFISGAVAGLLRDYLQQEQLDAPDICQALATFSGSQRMPMALWWELLESLQQQSPRPALGIHIGRCIQIHHIGVLGYLAMSCTHVGQALVRFQRFQPLLHNLLPLFVHMEGKEFCMGWDPTLARSTQLSNEVLMAGLIGFTKALSDHSEMLPCSVEFPDPAPADPAIYEALLGCPVRFGSPTLCLRLPAEVLSAPIRTGDPHLMALLDQQAEALLLALPQPDPVLAELQRRMVDALQEGEPTAAEMARQLDCSLRSLYRRLAKHGLRYRALLNDTRFQLARQYLADPTLSLPETALLLGFSEQSAFSRAFRAWAGCTPSEYRRKISHGA